MGLTDRAGGYILVVPRPERLRFRDASVTRRPAAPPTLLPEPEMPDQAPPMETVTVTAELPRDVAEQVKNAQMEDPDLLRRILTFGFSQKVIYDTLVANSWGR